MASRRGPAKRWEGARLLPDVEPDDTPPSEGGESPSARTFLGPLLTHLLRRSTGLPNPLSWPHQPTHWPLHDIRARLTATFIPPRRTYWLSVCRHFQWNNCRDLQGMAHRRR